MPGMETWDVQLDSKQITVMVDWSAGTASLAGTPWHRHGDAGTESTDALADPHRTSIAGSTSSMHRSFTQAKSAGCQGAALDSPDDPAAATLELSSYSAVTRSDTARLAGADHH